MCADLGHQYCYLGLLVADVEAGVQVLREEFQDTLMTQVSHCLLAAESGYFCPAIHTDHFRTRLCQKEQISKVPSILLDRRAETCTCLLPCSTETTGHT